MRNKLLFLLLVVIITGCDSELRSSAVISQEIAVDTQSIQSPQELTPNLASTETESHELMNNKKLDELDKDSIIIPLGNAPVIDGTIMPGEWDDAVVEKFTNGSELFLIQANDHFFVGIRSIDSGMIAANVFIQSDDEVLILHTSAALGTAIYQLGDDGWKQTQDFTWQCRNTSFNEVAQAERDTFLQQEGWVATNGRIGIPNELEYKIKIPESEFSMAVVYIGSIPPYEKNPWPVSLSDDTVMATPNGFPEVFQFTIGNWITPIFFGE